MTIPPSWGVGLVLVAICAAGTATISAQGSAEGPAPAWKGSVGGAYVWQEAAGNADSFRTQYNLREGFILEELTVGYEGQGLLQAFSLDASGFGGAWPTQLARLRFDFRGGIGLFLDYDRRDSFFDLAGSDFDQRADDWRISRWRAGVVVDTWEPVRFTVTLRRYDRDGQLNRPIFAHNEFYPATVSLDESMTEGAFRLETRTLPVRIEFEQAFARYENKNRRQPASPFASNGTNPNLLLESDTDVDDVQDVPTSRLTVSYAKPGFEGIGTLLYSNADLDASGVGTTDVAVDGGSIGRISYIDDLVGSAQMDALYGAANLGFGLTRSLILRVTTEFRDATTDTDLLGQRLLRGTSADGGTVVDFPQAVDENGRYEFRTDEARLRLEYRKPHWSVWAGAISAHRDVAWRQTVDDTPFAVQRDTDGFFVGATANPGRYLDINFEYEQGDFVRFVFRTDPRTVDRATFQLRSRFAKSWQLAAYARYETAENPPEIADLDHESKPYGLSLNWIAGDGDANVGIDVQRIPLHTDTGIVLPDGNDARSIYDLDLLSTSLHGGAQWGAFHLHGSAAWQEDDGETWPLESWNARARLDVQATARLSYGLFAEYWSYDEKRLDLDDYDVTRAGVALRWSSE